MLLNDFLPEREGGMPPSINTDKNEKEVYPDTGAYYTGIVYPVQFDVQALGYD